MDSTLDPPDPGSITPAEKPFAIAATALFEGDSAQRQDYTRLNALYGAARLLGSFETVESLLPRVLELCAAAFPLRTAILIERGGLGLTKSSWRVPSVAQTSFDEAIDYARGAFGFLTGLPLTNEEGKVVGSTSGGKLLEPRPSPRFWKNNNHDRFIVLPLVVDLLPAFGILQVESAAEIEPKDIEFIEALAGLIAIAIDRHHKTEFERAISLHRAADSAHALVKAEEHVSSLEEERALRESFVSLLSHDLKTPLTVIRITAQMLQRTLQAEEKPDSLALKIVASVDRADQMIADLLDANLIRSGGTLPLKLEVFDLRQLVEETLESLAAVHGKRFQFLGTPPLLGRWDRSGLRRIIENLASNAVKYGEPGEPIRVTLVKKNDVAELAVNNSGAVIPATDQKSLFDQFRRGTKALGSGKVGWGIGLALVRGVSEAHLGSVKVDSSRDEGTTFTVRLPLALNAALTKEGSDES